MDEMLADVGARGVDAQIDDAQLTEALQALRRRLVHVARADGCHHGQAAHGVQPSVDDAAMKGAGGRPTS